MFRSEKPERKAVQDEIVSIPIGSVWSRTITLFHSGSAVPETKVTDSDLIGGREKDHCMLLAILQAIDEDVSFRKTGKVCQLTATSPLAFDFISFEVWCLSSDYEHD